MIDTIIMLILLAIIVIAILRVKKRLKGGCCGSGSNTIREKKTLDQPVIGQKRMRIEGMTCENCAIRVENAVNRLDGALCRVALKKKTATVSLSREIPHEELKAVVEKMGYKVVDIQ